MKARKLHRWDVTPAEARRIQERLRGRVELQDRFGKAALRHEVERNSKIEVRDSKIKKLNSKQDIRYSIPKLRDDLRKAVRTVAGADVAFDFRAGGTSRGRAIAGVIVYLFPEMQEIERAWEERPLEFPYVPGLLSFRELPALLAAFEKLSAAPDVIFCDAQGYAHPRRFGLASHLGVVLDCVTVGCAKSRLIGEHEAPARAAGSWEALKDAGEIIGAVLRTREGVKPIYVSQGHRVSLSSAIELTMAIGDGFRIPKPTREADHFVEALKRSKARLRK